MRRILATAFAALVLTLTCASALEETSVTLERRSVSLYVPAVAQEEDGDLVGVLSVLTLTMQEPGRGDVFVRTEPLAEIDMQGAARLAVAAAAEITGVDVRQRDFYFTMTTGSPVIGGPSAGGAMAVAATAALMGWNLNPRVGMTGMINPDLSIGPVGGILQKAQAMAGVDVQTFLVPAGQTRQQVTVTETRPDGAVVTRQESIDIVAYAQREWGMTVMPVEDLYEAVPPFTGNRLEPPQAQGDPTLREEYQELMRELSGQQLANASQRFEAARQHYDRIQARLGAADRSAVAAALQEAENALSRARAASEQQRHYQASSYAFQSLVSSRYAQALLDFHASGSDAFTYTGEYLSESREALRRAREVAENPFPWTASELGSQGALENRLEEAEVLLEEAAQDRQQGQYASSLQDAAYARERIGSARWWGLLRDRLSSGAANVTQPALRSLYVEYDGSATLMLTYAERIVQESGAAAPQRLLQAAANLQRARTQAQEGQFAGALFGALHSMSQVNAAIAGLGGADLALRIDAIRERAAAEIERARALGIEPVFAVSLFEFAEAQRSQDPAAAHEGFTWARMSARATIVAAGVAPGPAEWSPVRFHPGHSLADRVFAGASWTWIALVAVPFSASLGLAAVLVSSRGEGKK